jgi:two-component sensor histidine kinase
VRFEVRGDAGRLPATIATPLSVVILELLQNVVDHAFSDQRRDGTVRVFMQRDAVDDALHLRVIDNGKGVDPSFDLASATGLGLSIVRTLVTTELGGSIAMRPAALEELRDAGFDATDKAYGTVVDLRIPVE